MLRLGESISTLLLHLHLFTLISAAQPACMRMFPACVRGASNPALSAEHTPAACQQKGRMGGCSCGLYLFLLSLLLCALFYPWPSINVRQLNDQCTLE